MAGVPVFYSPLTRSTRYWINTAGSRCYDYETDFMECARRTGIERAKTECSTFLDDWRECNTGLKQSLRYAAMRNARKFQKRPTTEAPPDDIVILKKDLI